MPRSRAFVWDSGSVPREITGQNLKDARSRLNLSQREFAQLLHHGTRTIVDWERDGVPEHKIAHVRAALGNALQTEGEQPPLEAYSDWALVSEIMRRLEARGTDSSDTQRPRPKKGRGAKKPDDQS